MGNKRAIAIAVLATFCLTVTLFMILPTKSNPETGQYDAWNDLNGDGQIDISDAILFAGTFNTAGDPTKNVNVTNWPSTQPEPAYKIIELPTINVSWVGSGSGGLSAQIYVGGFSKVFLYIMPQITSAAAPGTYTADVRVIYLHWYPKQYGNIGMYQAGRPYNSTEWRHTRIFVVDGIVNSFAEPSIYEDSYLGIKAPYMTVMLGANATSFSGWINVGLIAYLRNE